ncbi:histidine kinase [Pseudomonas wayambapalatensis]|uniref:histidine kinase n=1 Tax=Pseudomonas wayambapalatensis TaxID=485895 RepID=UPI003CF7A47E
MMERALLNTAILQDFLLDAQVLLNESQECLQHLELISNDADACHCLSEALDTLARRADASGVLEIAHYASTLHRLLAPGCTSRNLPLGALPTLADCLTLLAWQLELVDARTGHLNLDSSEQHLLLVTLADVLDQPLPHACALCEENERHCVHAQLLNIHIEPKHTYATSTRKD